MTRGELASLGLDDAMLVRGLRRETGRSVVVPAGDDAAAQARRRDAFELLMGFWYRAKDSAAA